MSDDIPQDQVEAVSRALCSARGTFEPDDFNKNSPNGKQWGLYFAQAIAAIRVLTPLIAAVERERCAQIAEAFRVSDSRAPHKNIRDGIARVIRSVKGAVT